MILSSSQILLLLLLFSFVLAQNETTLPQISMGGGMYSSSFYWIMISYPFQNTKVFADFGFSDRIVGVETVSLQEEYSYDEVEMDTKGNAPPPFFFGPLAHFFFIKEEYQFPSQLLALFFNRPTFSIVSYKNKNINSLQDCHGKTIGIFSVKWYFGLSTALESIFKENNITATIKMYNPIYGREQLELLTFHHEVDAVIYEDNIEVEFNINIIPNGLYTYTSTREFNYLDLSPFLNKFSKLFCFGLFVNQKWIQTMNNNNYTNLFIDNALALILHNCLHYRDSVPFDYNAFQRITVRFLSMHQFPSVNGIGNITKEEIAESLFWYKQLQLGDNLQFWNSIQIEQDLLFSEQQERLQKAYQRVIQYRTENNLTQPDFFALNYNESMLFSCTGGAMNIFSYCASDNVRPFIIFLILIIITHCLLIPFVFYQLILLCAFSKKQPTKSRFISPFVGNLVFLFYFLAIPIYCFGTIFYYVDPRYFALTFRMNPGFFADTILEAFIFFNFVNNSVFLLYMIQTVRYFYIRWTYTRMQLLISKPKLLKCNQFLILKVVFVLIYIFLGILFVGSFSPLYIVDNHDRDATTTNIVGLAISVLSGIFFLSITFTILVIDALVNAKKLLRCKCEWYFRLDDPHYFRLESLCFILLVIFGIALLISVGVNPDMDDSMEQAVFAAMLLTAYHATSLYLFGGGFIITTQFWTFCIASIQKRRRFSIRSTEIAKQKINEELESLLGNEKGYQLLHQYAAREFSVENVLCYKQVQLLLDMLQENQQSAIATWHQSLTAIHSEYISKNSALEINLSSSARNEFEKVLDQFTRHLKSPEENVELQLYQNLEVCLLELKKETLRNLGDTYSRCATTEEFVKFKKTEQEKQKMMKQTNLDAQELQPITPRHRNSVK